MNPKRFLAVGLLIVALIVAACGPQATPTPVPPTEKPAPTPVPTEVRLTPSPTAEKPAVSEGEVPMGFTEEGAPYRGNPNAPVTLEEHSDFQ